jgi:pimeloyl-ACP methyl ester carboxylesterase
VIPRTRYAKSGEVHIAYQVFGQGDRDLVYVPTSFSQLEHLWEEPSVASYLERLGSFARVILFDRRGAGLSDPVVSQTLEDQMADVTAVMDAAGSGKAALLAQLEGTPMAILYAATFPERVQAMVLITGFARTTWAEGYEWARPAADRERELIEPTVASWGEAPRAMVLAPSAAGDPSFLEWWGKLERLSAV